ncbi:hypothetical protein AA0117_g11021 [Alternaria alternata]|uniref:Secreted protein n=1 Tax=Alternaria alternata TaxID=5599 RepID=A0A4Q4N4J4_ALTAL|nr:hypothetical protein AA0117_g11021 [Alternaria alternata]
MPITLFALVLLFCPSRAYALLWRPKATADCPTTANTANCLTCTQHPRLDTAALAARGPSSCLTSAASAPPTHLTAPVCCVHVASP